MTSTNADSGVRATHVAPEPGRWSAWRPWGLVLAGGLVMGAALGVRHAQGLFLLPITLDRGWPRETFAFAFAMQNLVWGLAQPFTGMVADRHGAPRVIAGGLLLYAAGLLLMSQAASVFAFTLGNGLLIGLALSGTSFGVVYGALSRLFPVARSGWALGVAGAIGGLGQFLLLPTVQGGIALLGWPVTLLVLAALCIALLPAARPLREQGGASAPAAQSLGEALREAFGHRGFWLLNVGFFACGFQLAFITAHLPAYLLDRGMGAAQAVTGMAVIALTNVAGTYWAGHLGGLYRRKYLLTGLYLARTLAMSLFVLLPLTPVSLYAFCAVMGFLWLGTVPLTNGLVAQVFGVRYLTTLFGFVFFGHQLGGFLGVWLGGWVFDVTHSYTPLWQAGMVLGLVAAALHYPVDDRAIVRSPVPA